MNTFISYATEYDSYKGEKSVGSLSQEQQDELIRTVFDPSQDFRTLVVSHNLIKAQVEGLWAVVVLVGSALEGARLIGDFTQRTSVDIEKIIEALSGTLLWLRLEEAFPPFDVLPSRTTYDWKELEAVSMESLAGVAGESLITIKGALFKFLKSRPLILKPNIDARMPYHAFKHLYNEGKLALFVDRGLASVAGVAGIVKSSAPRYVFASLVTFIAALPIWYFAGFFCAVCAVVIAIFLFRRSFSTIVSEVRSSAISSKTSYRWLMSRKVVWVQQP